MSIFYPIAITVLVVWIVLLHLCLCHHSRNLVDAFAMLKQAFLLIQNLQERVKEIEK